MAQILLDTNALLMQIGFVDSQLGTVAKKLLSDADGVYVSSITLVELHIKTMIGKLDAPEDCSAMVLAAGNILLPYMAEDADALRKYSDLCWHDPFDRMLHAQAQNQKMLFMTTDKALLSMSFPLTIDARL